MADVLGEFKAVQHYVGTVGEHVIEFAEGKRDVTFNGHVITATELEHVLRLLYSAASSLGVVPGVLAP